MERLTEPLESRTTADAVFETLHHQIASLTLLPRTKISEAEVARQLGVSRQPVRDAFSRLALLGLVNVRPQRPTIVRGFSISDIKNARFVRLAVELEIVTRAHGVWDAASAEKLEENLTQQAAMIAADKTDEFHALDYQFHQLICECSGFPLAYELIETSKQKVDRLCMLSLVRHEEVNIVLDDHRAIAAALRNGSVKDLRHVLTKHLCRLDRLIEEIHETHSEYFE